MDVINKKKYYLDFFGLFCIGIVSLGYVIFNRPFAEMHIQFSFLNFPIFVGEIFFFICLCLYLSKGNLKIHKKHLWIVGYFAFILIKALCGYMEYGPLALRHSALFYYPAFIVFASTFYKGDFFDSKKNFLFSLLLILIVVRPGFNEYWLLTCVSLFIILSNTYSKKIFKYTALIVFLCIIPYKLFFATSRMMMVANFTAGIYLIIALYLIMDVRRSIKISMATLGIFAIALMIFQFADRNSLKTLARGDIIIEKFRESDEEFKEGFRRRQKGERFRGIKGSVYAKKTKRVLIYNPDRPLSRTQLNENTLENVKEIDEVDTQVEKNVKSKQARKPSTIQSQPKPIFSFSDLEENKPIDLIEDSVLGEDTGEMNIKDSRQL